jgi:dihydrofolate reductase
MLVKSISIIVALAENNAIGKDNKLLWHIPGDLKRVKKLTTGNVIVMGRNTYLSLPKRPLPDRINMVITDNPDEHFEGCLMAYSFDDALSKMSDTKENFIFGGASVYRQFLPLTSKLYLTKVYGTFDADTYFPQINDDEWQVIDQEDHISSSGKDLSYSFITLKKIIF